MRVMFREKIEMPPGKILSMKYSNGLTKKHVLTVKVFN